MERDFGMASRKGGKETERFVNGESGKERRGLGAYKNKAGLARLILFHPTSSRYFHTSWAGVAVVAGAAGGVLSFGGGEVDLLGLGGRGARPSIMSPI